MRLANPLSEEEPLLRTTLLPPLLGTLGATSAGASATWRSSRSALVFLPRPGAGAPPAHGRGPTGPTDEELAAADAVGAGASRGTWRRCWPATLEPAGWWGAGRAAGWADAIEAARTSLAGGRRARRAGHGAAAEHAPVAPGPVRRDRWSATPSSGTPASCTRPCCAALELPRRTCAMELDLDARARCPVVDAGPGISSFPPALIDVALVVRRRGAGGRRCEAALVDGAGRRCWRRCGCSTCTPAEQLGAGRKSLAYKLTFRAPDRTLTAEEAVAARDAAVAVGGGAVRRDPARRLTARWILTVGGLGYRVRVTEPTPPIDVPATLSRDVSLPSEAVMIAVHDAYTRRFLSDNNRIWTTAATMIPIRSPPTRCWPRSRSRPYRRSSRWPAAPGC